MKRLVALLVLLPSLAYAQPKLTRAPELVEFVEAPYPSEQLRAATVVLKLSVSANGTVDDALVVTSAGRGFDEAALAAARRFKFRPAEIDGKPAPVQITYRYAFVPKAVERTTGTLRGTVVDKVTGRPIAGVAIEVGTKVTTTDERGEFSLEDLAPGDVRVAVSRSDLTRLSTQETIEAGKTLETRYEIELTRTPDASEPKEADDLEVLVLAPKLVKQTVSTEVVSEDARRVAGTQGDVLKVVENLPGVARSAVGSGQVVVWGSAPEDTRTYVGAIRVPTVYHFGGLRSVVHNDHVRAVELVPGGYGAAYGRGLGGLVSVALRDPAKDRLHGSAQVDLLDASVAASGPLGRRVSFSVAGRRSHVSDASKLLDDQSFQQTFTIPRYADGQARLRLDLREGEHVEVLALASGDRQSRAQPSDDPARRQSETRGLDFVRLGLDYRRKLPEGDEVDVSPWYGRDVTKREADFGKVPTSLRTESHLVGFRAEWRGRLAAAWSGRVGFDLELVASESRRAGSTTSPPREGDPYVFGRPPADQVNADTWKSVVASAAPYGEVDFAPFGDRLHLTPGLRLEPHLVSVSQRLPTTADVPRVGAYQQDLSVQPRAAVRWALHPRVAYKGAVGLYRRPPGAEDLSAVFGNPALITARGTHFVGGTEVKMAETWTAEATVFHTRAQDLVARNPAENPRLGEALLPRGGGRSSGIQVLIRKQRGTGRVFGWLSYTLVRSQRQDVPDGPFRPFDFDQRHVLTALGACDLGRGFEVGVRVRAASGYPRTPVTGAFFDARRSYVEPTLGAVNTTRIPAFVSLDLRVAKRFRIGSTELETYLDVQNVTNRDNPEEIAYAPSYRERRYILGLPLLPVLGARWSF